MSRLADALLAGPVGIEAAAITFAMVREGDGSLHIDDEARAGVRRGGWCRSKGRTQKTETTLAQLVEVRDGGLLCAACDEALGRWGAGGGDPSSSRP